LKQLVSAHPL